MQRNIPSKVYIPSLVTGLNSFSFILAASYSPINSSVFTLRMKHPLYFFIFEKFHVCFDLVGVSVWISKFASFPSFLKFMYFSRPQHG